MLQQLTINTESTWKRLESTRILRCPKNFKRTPMSTVDQPHLYQRYCQCKRWSRCRACYWSVLDFHTLSLLFHSNTSYSTNSSFSTITLHCSIRIRVTLPNPTIPFFTELNRGSKPKCPTGFRRLIWILIQNSSHWNSTVIDFPHENSSRLILMCRGSMIWWMYRPLHHSSNILPNEIKPPRGTIAGEIAFLPVRNELP